VKFIILTPQPSLQKLERGRYFPGLWKYLIVAGVLCSVSCFVGGKQFARAQQNFINVAYWPVDARYRTVTAYPDTPWTHSLLGLVGECPPYNARSFEDSEVYWREADVPIDIDWLQASQGNRHTACYENHAGVDIVTPAGAAVYTVADGVISAVEQRINEDDQEDGYIEIVHSRKVQGELYEWTSRYVHLVNDNGLSPGDRVLEGQLIEFVADRDENTHLHFEINDTWYCEEACVVNPFGPTYLWIDDNRDSFPDPAAAFVPPAPVDTNLIANRIGEVYVAPYTLRTGMMVEVRIVVENESAGWMQWSVGVPDVGPLVACDLPVPAGDGELIMRVSPDAAWHNVMVGVDGGGDVQSVEMRRIDAGAASGCGVEVGV